MRNRIAINILSLLSAFLISAVIITGCSSKKNTPVPAPAKATLTFPAQNSVCTTGIVTSTTQCLITFTWVVSGNTDSYELNIKNLLTNAIITQSASANTLTVTLLRNTPYSWYIISKSANTSTTAQSDTWKFYNAGLGTTSHIPFPADVVAPAFGQSVTATGGTINLIWTGSDVDNDIVGYDIYFGTTATPALLKSNVTDSFLNSVAVRSGTTYYWKVTTKDSQGNTSDSDAFQFTVN